MMSHNCNGAAPSFCLLYMIDLDNRELSVPACITDNLLDEDNRGMVSLTRRQEGWVDEGPEGVVQVSEQVVKKGLRYLLLSREHILYCVDICAVVKQCVYMTQGVYTVLRTLYFHVFYPCKSEKRAKQTNNTQSTTFLKIGNQSTLKYT